MSDSIKGYDFGVVTGKVIGAAIEVHKELGSGFMEAVYQRALGLELKATGLHFGREVEVPIYYKGEKIDTRRADFVVEDCIVEIKAKRELQPEDYVQALNYLKSSGFPVGLLINFGAKSAEFKRLVNTKPLKRGFRGLIADDADARGLTRISIDEETLKSRKQETDFNRCFKFSLSNPFICVHLC
jgi:GxxExxY protein